MSNPVQNPPFGSPVVGNPSDAQLIQGGAGLADQLVSPPWRGYFQSVNSAIRGLQGTPGIPNLVIQQPTNLVCDGDSLTVGYPGLPPNSSPGQIAERLATPVTNLGVDGAQSSNVIATHLSVAATLVDPQRLNIYNLGIGRNDLAGSVPVATLQANIQTIIAAMHGAGYQFVIVNTIAPSGLAGQPPGFDADRVTYNNWLLGGGSSADLVCNSGNDPLIADLTAAPFSTFSGTYFQPDKVHLTKAGYAVLAINAAASMANLIGPIALLPIDPFGQILKGSFARDINYKPYIDVYNFGVVSTASAAINTQGIQNACAAAALLGLPVVFPENSYNIQKTNLLAFNGFQQYPLTLMSLANDKNSNGHGTRLICDGTGPSWLRGAINVIAPNAGNTAPDWSQQLHGLRLEGIYVDQVNGIGGGSLSGFWLGHVWDFTVQDCGTVIPPGGGFWNGGIETWASTAGVINRFRALTCASGIALNGGTGATGLPTASSSILVIQPDCENCTSAGITTQLSNYCKIIGGYLVNNAVGFYGNGPEATLQGVYFSGNTADVNMLVGTAPYGGTVTPNQQLFIDCSFSANVNVNHSVGTSFVACKWEPGSSLTIAATATATNLLQQNSFPTSFTDAGVATYIASVLIGTVNPNSGAGTPGITGQFIYDATHSVLYMCTTSGVALTSVWTAMPGAGGSGITSLNGLTGAAQTLAAGTGMSVASAGTTHTFTNTAPYTAPGAWSTYTPTIVNGGGGTATLAISSSLAHYQQVGKQVFYQAMIAFSVSGSTTPSVRFSMPVNPFSASDYQNLAGNLLQGSTPILAFVVMSSSDNRIGLATSAALAIASYTAYLSGVYEAA